MTNSRGFFGSGGVAQGTSTSTPVDSRDLDSNYGPAFFDATHMFSMAGNYDLPFGKDRAFGSSWNRVLDAVAGGWSVQFGLPRAQWIPDHRAARQRRRLALRQALPARPSGRDRIGSGEVDNPTLDRWIDRFRRSSQRRRASSATRGSASCVRRASGISTSRSASGLPRPARNIC